MGLAGLVAGYVPAKQATNTKLVETLKDMLTVSTRHRQRLMTAFGVFWGTFILIVLLGSGTGLDNGIISKVNTLPPNEMWIAPEETSMPYRGLGRGRKWLLNTTVTPYLGYRYNHFHDDGNMSSAVSLNLRVRTAAVYNHKNYFVGFQGFADHHRYKSKNSRLVNSTIDFTALAGIRF